MLYKRLFVRAHLANLTGAQLTMSKLDQLNRWKTFLSNQFCRFNDQPLAERQAKIYKIRGPNKKVLGEVQFAGNIMIGFAVSTRRVC